MSEKCACGGNHVRGVYHCRDYWQEVAQRVQGERQGFVDREDRDLERIKQAESALAACRAELAQARADLEAERARAGKVRDAVRSFLEWRKPLGAGHFHITEVQLAEAYTSEPEQDRRDDAWRRRATDLGKLVFEFMCGHMVSNVFFGRAGETIAEWPDAAQPAPEAGESEAHDG